METKHTPQERFNVVQLCMNAQSTSTGEATEKA